MSAHVADQARDLALQRLVTYEFPMGGDLPPLKKTLIEHPDGIYITLPELDYLNDWALSYSAFKTIISSPPDWHWDSLFNLVVDQTRTEETAAMRFGSALHVALLEGLKQYLAKYGVPPSKESHPKALRTQADLKEALSKLGEKTSGNKDEQIERLLLADPKAEILDVLVDDWNGLGLIALSREEDAQLRLMVQLAAKHPDLKAAFGGVGLSEVSVFWTDVNGVRQRARLDRVKPNASIDLKSFSNWQGRDFHKALLREAALRFYDIQAHHYDIARQEARRLVAEGKVYVCFEERVEERLQAGETERWGITADRDGAIMRERKLKEGQVPAPIIHLADEETMKLAQTVFAPEVWEWVWIFYKTDGAPTAQPVRLSRDTKAFERGGTKREEALALFLTYRETFGLTNMWLRMDPMWTPTDEDWPFFMGNDG